MSRWCGGAEQGGGREIPADIATVASDGGRQLGQKAEWRGGEWREEETRPAGNGDGGGSPDPTEENSF